MTVPANAWLGAFMSSQQPNHPERYLVSPLSSFPLGLPFPLPLPFMSFLPSLLFPLLFSLARIFPVLNLPLMFFNVHLKLMLRTTRVTESAERSTCLLVSMPVCHVGARGLGAGVLEGRGRDSRGILGVVAIISLGEVLVGNLRRLGKGRDERHGALYIGGVMRETFCRACRFL